VKKDLAQLVAAFLPSFEESLGIDREQVLGQFPDGR